jgi:hypothetical protein
MTLGVGRVILQQGAEMGEVVVAEDTLGAVSALDPLDHRGVVQLVRIDDDVRHDLGERGQRRLVRDIARREEQRGFLAVQAGQLFFEFDVVAGRARDVAGSFIDSMTSGSWPMPR